MAAANAASASATTVFSWGRSSELQLGRKGDTARIQTWPKKMPHDKQWRLVAAAYTRSAAITADGELWTWGVGYMGELGLAYIEKVEEPTKISKVPPHTNFMQVACGKEHTLALTDGGLLYSWGANELGQLGQGHTKMLDRPTRLPTPAVKFIQVDAGANHSAGVSEFGEIYTWGADYAGQLGQKEQELAKVGLPVKIDIPVTFKAVSCGEFCSAAISNKGEVYTWGAGGHGRLGHGSTENVGKPTLVKAVETVNFAQVSVGFNHVLALTDTGWVWAWGAGLHGELGYGGRRRQLKPVEVACPEKMKQVVAGYEVSFAIGMSGALYVWGNCEFGTAGVGRRIGIIDKPFKVASDLKFKQLAAAQHHVIALGAGDGAPPPGWSSEDAWELHDPTADTSPLAALPVINLAAERDKAKAGDAAKDQPAAPARVPASVEALQRLARVLEKNVAALEAEYGYKAAGEAAASSGALSS